MGLFKFLEILFCDYTQYCKIDMDIKIRYAHIVNRVMSIKYPLHANFYNNKYIPQLIIMNTWALVASKNAYKFMPEWVEKIIVKQKTNKYSDDEIKLFCKVYKISRTDFENLDKIFPSFLENEIKIIKKCL